jgi:UDP-N-acetylmuramoyl-L-alanyl-D-glutamate--2,6-diaminopimelate ligase
VCAISVLGEMGINIDNISDVLETVVAPPGRTDIINYNSNLIIVDYAHTPDAMENIYNLVKEIKKGKVYTVFGCTGDRDRTKRPIMMELATTNSDYVIFTSDDLHNEDFNRIVSDAIDGIKKTNYEVVINRGTAIEKSINMLGEKDILLVLGKGHEEFIIMKDKKIPFNDRNEIEKLIKESINL